MRNLAGAMAFAVLGTAASAQDFGTRLQAMDYISATLPRATADNPTYFTKSNGAETRWLTDDVAFASNGAGTVTVTMREHFVATKKGKTVEAKHEARFSAADVNIGPYLEVGDLTPLKAAAVGIGFACRSRGCVAAHWGGLASPADKTDVYVQDVATRDRLLAAFRRLQAP